MPVPSTGGDQLVLVGVVERRRPPRPRLTTSSPARPTSCAQPVGIGERGRAGLRTVAPGATRRSASPNARTSHSASRPHTVATTGRRDRARRPQHARPGCATCVDQLHGHHDVERARRGLVRVADPELRLRHRPGAAATADRSTSTPVTERPGRPRRRRDPGPHPRSSTSCPGPTPAGPAPARAAGHPTVGPSSLTGEATHRAERGQRRSRGDPLRHQRRDHPQTSAATSTIRAQLGPCSSPSARCPRPSRRSRTAGTGTAGRAARTWRPRRCGA